MKHYYKEVLLAFALVVSALIFWHAVDVFFLAFAAILLAIFLNAMGRWTQKVIRLPYTLSLVISLIVIGGFFALIFWLYSPLISSQVELLVQQLPEAAKNLRDTFTPYLSTETLQKELSFSNEKMVTQLVSFFSMTIGALASFAIFLIVGFYLALLPQKYLRGAMFLTSDRTWEIVLDIGKSIRYWLLGKVLSMIAIGILTFIGLWLLDVSLAFILALLAGLLTFIPYVGPILASVPAILIAFASGPLLALYVILLYIGVHILEGYLITPFIEQQTVSIPPALTIMGQILILVLVGGLGLALATPLIVVAMTLVRNLKRRSVNMAV